MNNVNPGLINPVYGCLIGRVPYKKVSDYDYWSTPLINKQWFINPGLTLLLRDRHGRLTTLDNPRVAAMKNHPILSLPSGSL